MCKFVLSYAFKMVVAIAFLYKKCIRLDLQAAGSDTIFFKSIWRHPQGSQGCQKFHKNMLQINVLSFWPFGSQNIKNRVYRFELFSDHLPL